MGPGESSFLLLLYSTPSCITLLYWSLGSIVVSACVRMCPSYIHPATKGHFISHLSQRPVSLKSRHTHIFVLKFLQVAPNSSSKPHLHLWLCVCFFCKATLCFPLLRDFAYVARDKNTRILKCHVFRCDTPAKAIATSLHEICSRVSCSGRRRFQTQEANFGILADGCDEASQVVGQMFSLPLNIKAHGEENVVLMDFNFFLLCF